MNESRLSKNIRNCIRARDGGWAYKTHGNRYGQGLPDIVGCYRQVFLGLEVKLPGRENTLTALQAHTLESIGKAGGVGKMVTSVKQVEAILDAIDRRRDGNRRRA